MGDRNDFRHPSLPSPINLMAFQNGNDQAQQELLAEKAAAERQAILAEAYRQMPPDLRARAREWGVSTLMEAVWLNGWDCGYRQSLRDAADIASSKE